MSVFNVKYWKKNKPNGTRNFQVFGINLTYEKVLFEFTISHLCERNYSHNYEWFMLNEHVFAKRLIANGARCEYEILLYEMNNFRKLLAEYNIEIECLENDNSADIFKEALELKEPRIKKLAKEKSPTEWFLKESIAIRNFLIMLQDKGSLKELKKSNYLSKATYYRNLKTCEEKGYVKNGRLVKRLLVAKQQR